MSGPPPKDPALRQRRNKVVTAAEFETVEQARAGAPPLGEHPEGNDWHPRTVEWWRRVWASPMREEFLRADEDGLCMLATLVDQFWRDPSAKLAAEIRLQRQCYGLTSLDRRRLQWEVKRVEEAERPRAAKPKAKSVEDPRAALRAI